MKTKIESNYHTHTFLCKHAIGDVEDYVKRAIQLGYHTIAITDHGPFTKELQKSLLLEE
ncbi:MAG: PHP domain-containing protein [Bacilli bacterium]